MTIVYKVLGQINPSSNVATTLYTVPTYVSTVISTITVCNQASTDTTFSIAVRPSGDAIESKHYLNYNTTVSANDTIPITVGLTLATTDVITASAASGTVSFVAFGSEISTIIPNIPAVTSLTVTDSSYNALTSTAVSLSGGYIKLAGSGFTSGATVYVNGVAATSTTFVSGIEVRAQVPAASAGTYSVMVFNSSGLGAIYANGIVYSAAPSWTSTSYDNQTNIVSVQLLATGDIPLTYSLQAGSSLPSGVTLSSTGLISGTASGITTTTTVNFTVVVQDVELQTTPQSIALSITIYVARLYSWGLNSDGYLGQGDTINRSSPIQVGSLANWLSIAAGYAHTISTKIDGTLWASARNLDGQLGDGTTINRSSPVQVGSLTTWSIVSAGRRHSVATKTDGTIWAWGRNAQGQLGDGTTVDKSSPIQVGLLTTWLNISAGQYATVAIKTNGTIWTWGQNVFGTLGTNDTIDRSSPVQVGSLSNWSLISSGNHSVAAIKTDGTLWSWGFNSSGKLGLNNTTYYSSPVQVGALTNWSKISSSLSGNHTLAIKTNGTLWAWGKNSYGQLGDGTTINRSSPVQIGALTAWSMISPGNNQSLSTKTDGTLWAWGRNNDGQLGLGNTISLSSPVQVGSLTTWLSIAGGGNNFALAISG
jgi:alpha-tubulin suppressor-like RCC1 family protein